MAEIRSLKPVDHAERIAAGLIELAGDIRAGKLKPIRAGVVFSISPPGEGHDDVGFCFYGADASSNEMVGLLEQAKFTLLSEP